NQKVLEIEKSDIDLRADGFCPKGFVKNTSCPTDVSKHCVPCKNGKEYTDHVNDLDKCLRCYSCDSVFGLEVAKNCTPAQNTECTCAKDYFCNSSVPFYAFILKYEIFNIVCSHTFFQTVSRQRLSSHVAGIVEEMTLQEVKTFVRNHKVPEPVIDQTVRDYFSDTSEQKIKLFQVWYQRHGIKGAYGTLINSLRDFKMCTAADKIEEKLKAAVSSCQEGGQSYNDDTEQSKTCTQECRNSYNGTAELSKTYSGSLEET
uniref:Tumor necrosis factor receptor superfamily member 6 n=1 Tax=Accipiter nisus TaxID=211598 RepID=A0A8B9NG60_9AVES